jgi:hypothetical protein
LTVIRVSYLEEDHYENKDSLSEIYQENNEYTGEYEFVETAETLVRT